MKARAVESARYPLYQPGVTPTADRLPVFFLARRIPRGIRWPQPPDGKCETGRKG